MNPVRVTEKELLYLSVLSGIENIWGLPDVFSEMPESEIRIVIGKLQASLTSKQYAKHLFDEPFALDEDLLRTIKRCAWWNKLLILKSGNAQVAQKRELRWFLSDAFIGQYSHTGEQIEISSVQPESLHELICTEMTADGIPWRKSQDSLVSSSTKIRRFASLSRRRFLEELQAMGCSEEFSALLADGLQGQTNYRSLTLFRRSVNGGDQVARITVLYFGNSGLMVMPRVVDGKDSLCFSVYDKDELCRMIEESILLAI